MTTKQVIENTQPGTPLVRGRSKVQSFPAAPEKPDNSRVFDGSPDSYPASRYGTKRETRKSTRVKSGESVQDLVRDFDRAFASEDDAALRRLGERLRLHLANGSPKHLIERALNDFEEARS